MFEKTKPIYEVTTAKTLEELNRDGGQLTQFDTKAEAERYAKKMKETMPYVYFEKCFVTEEHDYVDSVMIWSHNPNNW